jgi:hypothetical protein
MERSDLIAALQELDARLSSSCDIAIVGGAAMILHFGASRATRDIDVLVLRGDIMELRQAARLVAHARELPEDWMNDAVKGFADILPSDFYHRLVSLGFPFQHLRLYALGLPEQVAMKIVALREQDLEDLELLIPSMSDAEQGVLVKIMDRLSGVRPDWAQRIRYFLLERGWKIE